MTAATSITTITTATRTFIWQDHTPRHGPASQRLYVNTMWIGWARPALTQKGSKTDYEWSCMLPGLKKSATSGKCATIEGAKYTCLTIAKRWFKLTDSRQ